jgi:hypothetical protein
MPGCIYCESTDFSKEHHLPRCLGNFRGYVTLNDRVCVGCNGKCKTLDEQLCRSGGESFFREYLGITGRKNQEKANPFYRGSSGGGRLGMEGTSSVDGRTVSLELEKGEVRELRHVSLITRDGKQHLIPIPVGMTPEEFKVRFDRLQIERAKHAHVYASADEIPWIESLLGTLKFEKNVQWEDGSEPIQYKNVVINFTVTERYFRAIAKIGFHYFLSTMPQFRGDEKCFEDIRNFIMTEGD